MAATIAQRQILNPSRSRRWSAVELFVLIQTLSTGLLFFPESQSYRFIIRALPYASSIAFALLYYNRTRRTGLPPGGALLGGALILLALNLFHSTTVFPAGIAQVAFQITIAAPMLWVALHVQDKERLERILWLMFLTSGASALLGLAQVFYPQIFMPEISALALRMDPEVIRSLSYIGSSGQQILRPPGLTDLPGGAAIGGFIAGLLGILFGSQSGSTPIKRGFCFVLAAIGISVIYFTQVRAFLIMLVFAIIGMCIIMARQTRFAQTAWIGSVGAVLLIATFTWAVTVGGKPVLDRFTSLTSEGISQSFQQNRGIFIQYTLENMLFEFPFGAGVGRWGTMNIYFGNDSSQPKPIYVEIQMTGWLLDGGIFMWVLYGGAIIVSLWYIYRVSVSLVDVRLAYLASIVLCLNVFVVGLSFAGPAFNTQLGIQFWLLTAALYGAARKVVPAYVTNSQRRAWPDRSDSLYGSN